MTEIIINRKSAGEIHEHLLAQAREERERARAEYERHIGELYEAKMVELAAGDDKEAVLRESEKVILKETESKRAELKQDIAFWDNRIRKLEEYDFAKFDVEKEDYFADQQAFLGHLFKLKETDD
jgi:hypothetical protein